MLLREFPAISELDVTVGNGHTKRELTSIAIVYLEHFDILRGSLRDVQNTPNDA